MIRNRTLPDGTVLAVAMLRVVAIGLVVGIVAGCAAPGSVSARSGISPLPSSAAASSAGEAAVSSAGEAAVSSAGEAAVSSAGQAPASSARPAPASSTEIVGMGPPPCPFADLQLILGPNAAQRPGTDAAIHKPFGDVGVNFGPQQPGATVLWARLDVVVTDAAPIPGNPTADPSSFNAAEDARPDSFRKLMAGTDPHVARVILKPFAAGPFVIPAAILNALPVGVPSYTVYLVESVDESVCFGATPDPSLADSDMGSGFSVIAELVP
jgi:hypothetical protein